MYRGRITLMEALDMPHSIFLSLFKLQMRELEEEAARQREAGETMEDEINRR